MKQLILSLTAFVALSLFATHAHAAPSHRASSETIDTFIEGRDDAVRHVLSFANIQSPNKSIPGMQTYKFYRRKNPSQQSAYASGAIFAYSHIASMMRRDDLVRCYNNYYNSAGRALNYIYHFNPSIGSRNVISVLLNFCVSTNEMSYMSSRAFK